MNCGRLAYRSVVMISNNYVLKAVAKILYTDRQTDRQTDNTSLVSLQIQAPSQAQRLPLQHIKKNPVLRFIPTKKGILLQGFLFANNFVCHQQAVQNSPDNTFGRSQLLLATGTRTPLSIANRRQETAPAAKKRHRNYERL